MVTKKEKIKELLEEGELSDEEIAEEVNTVLAYVREIKSSIKETEEEEETPEEEVEEETTPTCPTCGRELPEERPYECKCGTYIY